MLARNVWGRRSVSAQITALPNTTEPARGPSASRAYIGPILLYKIHKTVTQYNRKVLPTTTRVV